MPPLIVAAAAALATAAATAGTVAALGGTAFALALGTTGFAAFAATVGAVVGAVVAYAGNALLAGSAKRPSTQQAVADARQTVRSSVEPRRVVYGRARVSGPIVYAASIGDQKENLVLVVPVAGHVCDGFDGIYLNNAFIGRDQIAPGTDQVIAGPYAGRVLVQFYDGTQTASDPLLSADSPDGWGESDKLLGVAYFRIVLIYEENLFRNGVPNFSAAVVGKSDIRDPRSGVTGYNNNWALVILDYLRSPFGLACSDDEIDIDSFMAAANVSDELIDLSEYSLPAERRYTLNGTFQLDRTPLDIVEEMVAAGGGALVYVQGRYRLYAGAYVAPTVTITASDLAGPVDLATTPSRRDRFNALRGTYIEPASGGLATEFPMVVDAAGVAEDGEQIVRDLDLPWINSGTAAQRMAWQMLKRHRAGQVVRMPLRYASFALTVMDTVAVTLADFGWTAKPFRVIAWTFDPGTGIINVTLQEEQPLAYAFTASEARPLPVYPDTTLVSPFALLAPSGLAVAEELYATRDGAGVRNKAVLTWSPVANPFVTAYDVQHRPMGSGAWRIGVSVPGDTLTAEVLDLAAGEVEFRVRARSSVGSGEWASSSRQMGALAAVLPADIAGFTAQISGGMAWVRWTRHPDLDVRAGGRIEFRHHPETGGAWVNATSIGEAAPGSSNFTALPLRTGRYFAKAVDAGGRYSVNAASFFLVQDGQHAYTNLASITYDPTFTGAQSNTVVTSSTLRLVSLGLLDAVASFDAIADLDGLGGIAPSGTSTATAALNFGSARHVRLTPTLRATVVNTLDQWDSRAGNIDQWADVDGAVGGEADAWVEYRFTTTDPAGSPVYTAWARLDGAEVRAWGVQFRCQLRSFDPAFNIHVDQFRVSADQVV